MTDYTRISSELGKKHWLGSTIHDHAEFGGEAGGGKTTISLSAPGSGKTTLSSWVAQSSKYVPPPYDKHGIIRAIMTGEIYTDPVFLETVIWRIRDGDGFPRIIKENWVNSFRSHPDWWNGNIAKDVHIWVHEDDMGYILFYSINKKNQQVPILHMPKIETYRNAEDLIRRLHWGAINAVLEPQEYQLSPTLITKLREKRMDVKEDVEKVDYRKNLKKERVPHKKQSSKNYAGFAQREVSPSYFWFELIHVAKDKNDLRHITFVIDEVDDIFEARSEGDVWKLIDILASDWKDLRKVNISTHLTTHQTDFVDWRIMKRADYIIWMLGAEIKPSFSMIKKQNIVSDLPMGMFLIEKRKIEFGVCPFNKIPNAQPAARIDGLKGEIKRLPDTMALGIMKAYQDCGVIEV
jgi:hypothetical protein